MNGLLDRLRRGEVVLGDGALGTMLIERGLEPGQRPEALVLEKPEIATRRPILPRSLS